MVTGASTADLAVILIDARKGVLTQTRRHSYLVSLLGHPPRGRWRSTRWTWSTTPRTSFDEIEADYRAFADQIGLDDVTCIPMSALKGDNITEPSDEHALVRRPDADRAPGDASRSTTTCSARPVPHAGAVGQPPRPRLPRLLRHRSSAARVRPATRSGCCPSGQRQHRRRASSPTTATSTRPSPASRSPSRWPTRSTSAAATCWPPPTRRPRSPTSSRPHVVWMDERADAARAGPTC